MCEIDINDLQELNPELQMAIYEDLRMKRLEQLKKQDIIKMQFIERVVCKKFNVDPKDIRNDTREDKICIPRNVIFSLSLEKTKLKEHEVGECYGFKRGRVHHAKKVVSDLFETDKKFRNKIDEIKQNIT